MGRIASLATPGKHSNEGKNDGPPTSAALRAATRRGSDLRLRPQFHHQGGRTRPGAAPRVLDYTTQSSEEPNDHTQPTEDEIFYVVHGAITFRCDDSVFELDDGGFVFLPRGIEHGYTIRSAGEVRLLVVTSPADEEAEGGWGGLIGSLEAAAHGAAS